MALATVTLSAYIPVEQPRQMSLTIAQFTPPPPRRPPRRDRSLTERSPVLATVQSTPLQLQS
ncbi:MAG: hypothetical protein NW220_19415 [Leptolyngbyaceae cyanobacterium bins.349]|nr:hypothetical protein [Leptolyngbyaceae cyanobacterium bins.349]